VGEQEHEQAAADEPLQRERDDQEAQPEASGGDVPYDAIAKRAYEIWESGEGGSAQENWERAATELGADPKR